MNEYLAKLKTIGFGSNRKTNTTRLIDDDTGHVAGYQVEHADDSTRLDAIITPGPTRLDHHPRKVG